MKTPKLPSTVFGVAILAAAPLASAQTNTSVGQQAGASITTGVSNTAAGFQALFRDTSGSFNVAVGDGALLKNKTGNNNIGIGVDAGANVVSGNDNIYIDHPGRKSENGRIRIGTKGTHTRTFLTGVVHGDGSALRKVTVLGKNIRGKIPPSRINAGSLNSSKLASNLTLGGTTTGTFTGNLNGNAATATNATNAVTAETVADTDYRLAVTGTAAFGDDATNFVFDAVPGLLLETQLTGGGNDTEGAGLFLGTNEAVIYSSGDEDILKVIDEDELSGSATPAFRVLDSNAGILTPGSVNAGTSVISSAGTAPGGVELLGMLRGIVSTAGTTTEGSGFTSVRNATGDYTITFTTPFTDTPAVTAIAFDAADPETVTIQTVSATSCRLRIWDETNAAVDSVFHFNVMGPR
ncbi:MAG: hypothetical protein V4733_06130 [Verrucomicrobiota bacterium]